MIDNRIAQRVEEHGLPQRCSGEGADHLLGWRSPHRVYRAQGTEKLKLLLRNYRLSDDIAFRFSNRGWAEWPLTAETFADWMHAVPAEDELVSLFMDYETFGEHQWADTGIFEFMRRPARGDPRATRASHFRTPSRGGRPRTSRSRRLDAAATRSPGPTPSAT